MGKRILGISFAALIVFITVMAVVESKERVSVRSGAAAVDALPADSLEILRPDSLGVSPAANN
jgi:hypothetical protein